MDSNPICHHSSPAKKIKCSFLDYIQLQLLDWSPAKKIKCQAGADGLEPHLPPLSSQQNKMLIFGLRLTSDDQPGW